MGQIDPSAWIAPSAVVTGDVTIGAPERHCDLWAAQDPLDFPGTVYGVSRGTPMREIMRQQCEAFGPKAAYGPED